MVELSDLAGLVKDLCWQLENDLNQKFSPIPSAAAEDLAHSLAEIAEGLDFSNTSISAAIRHKSSHPTKGVHLLAQVAENLERDLRGRGWSSVENPSYVRTLLLVAAARLSYYSEQIEDRYRRPDLHAIENTLRTAALPYRVDRIVPLPGAGMLAFANAEMDRFEIPQLGEHPMGDESEHVPVDIYIDSDNDGKIAAVVNSATALLKAMGYEELGEPEIYRGSIFRRSKAVANQGIDELKNRLMKVERGIELAQLDLRQAEVNSKEAEAASNLLASLEGVPRACVRVGSLLIVKYTYQSEPVVLIRNLTQVEMHALGRFPEIQKNPERALEMLATAIANMPESGDVLPLQDGEVAD